MLEYDVLVALGYSGTLRGSLPVCRVLFCVRFSMLTVHPEHANAKPVMMRIVKTVLNSFINPALLQFQINLVVIARSAS